MTSLDSLRLGVCEHCAEDLSCASTSTGCLPYACSHVRHGRCSLGPRLAMVGYGLKLVQHFPVDGDRG